MCNQCALATAVYRETGWMKSTLRIACCDFIEGTYDGQKDTALCGRIFISWFVDGNRGLSEGAGEVCMEWTCVLCVRDVWVPGSMVSITLQCYSM